MRHHARAAFTANGLPVTVHALHAGSVTVKRCHANCCLPERSPAPLRLLSILADRRFADPMPIWSYAIEHPEGLFVIDAGASASYNDPESWRGAPRRDSMIKSFIKLDVARGATVPDRLRQIGLAATDARALILTHQHIDHTGTVPAFAGVEIWTTRAEDNAAPRIGALHWRWRDANTHFRYIDDEGSASDLGATVTLTTDGTLTAIHTPGHTPGSVSVRLRTDQTDIWFTGDTSFTAAGMDPTSPTAGIHSDMAQVRALQARLQHVGVILPSHDPDVPERLTAAANRPASAR